jgi:ribosomal protein S18 acetylase RimI-like enzyme
MTSHPPDPLALLDNIVWHTLSGPHACFAVGTDAIRRYAPGFPPLAGARNAEAADWAALAPYCVQGDQFYCAAWTGQAPAGWRVDLDATMEQYVWNGGMPAEDDVDAVLLSASDADQTMALVALTHPGPFGPRTPELGSYYGVFEDGRLVAMAGERMHAGPLREISGVCTHPDRQGRGLARRLMQKLVRAQLAQGQIPFLHVMSTNRTARMLYQRMGFRHHRGQTVRVLTYAGTRD